MLPFSSGDTYTEFDKLIKGIVSEINSLDNEYVLKASKTELEQYFIDKVLIKPLKLYESERYIKNQTGTKIDIRHDFNRFIIPGGNTLIKGTRLDIAIPFEGDPMLWGIRASTFSLSGYPEIEILKNEVVFNVSFPDDSAKTDNIRANIERITKSLVDAVNNLKIDIDKHNDSSPNKIRKSLKHKITLAQSAIGAVAALGIPIKKKDTEPTFTIPTSRRGIPAKRPSVPTGKYEPEPILDEKEYQHILEILRSMSLVIERNPSSFASLHEEAIRDIFLIQLNGHYEGSATGETFNASGKTDILIRVENKNVFIAECKFWHGPKAFDEAIDQLLSYLTWRDSKCALLIFNKTKDSSSVRQKMHNVIKDRSQHRKTVFHKPDGDSLYILVKDSDPGRDIYITTQLYDIPCKK